MNLFFLEQTPRENPRFLVLAPDNNPDGKLYGVTEKEFK